MLLGLLDEDGEGEEDAMWDALGGKRSRLGMPRLVSSESRRGN